MRKAIILVILLTGVISAQSKIVWSAGGNLALPMGSFADAASIGFGATAGAEMQIKDKIVGTATIGYLIWGGKEIDLGFAGKITTDYSSIPILVGGKYFFSNGFYGQGQLGFHLFSAKAESKISIFGTTTTTSASSSSTDFTIGLGGGYEMGKFDFSAAYYLISNANYLGARIAYKFN